MRNLPYSRQFIDEKDIDEVVKVLRSDWISPGPRITEFEEALADYCGSRYAVAVSSGTAALHLAMLALGISGGEAVTTPVTFLATANSAVYAGAEPVFSDIDYASVNLDADKLPGRITGNTKVVVPVHFAGLPCSMKKIRDISRKRKINVVEDGCHALGSSYRISGKWHKVGSCRHSDITVFSFHPVKNITTGEGGAVTTNSRRLYQKVRLLRSHGIYKTANMSARKGRWYLEMRGLGFNYRMTNFQAALGLSQLKKLDTFVARRRGIASVYDHEFKGLENVEIPEPGDGFFHSYHLYLLKIDFRKIRISRERFMRELADKGIFTQVHYIPLYRQPYYRENFGYNTGDYPESEKYYKKALSIPVFPQMTPEDALRVSKEIKKLVIR